MTRLVAVRPGQPAYAELVGLLASERLATADLDGGRFYAPPGTDGGALAFAGLAGEGPDQMLRSVVVRPASRKRGLGELLVAAVEAMARQDGATRLWLLTADAAPFFARAGYARVDRADAPAPVAESAQFRGLCAASAPLMCKSLG